MHVLGLPYFLYFLAVISHRHFHCISHTLALVFRYSFKTHHDRDLEPPFAKSFGSILLFVCYSGMPREGIVAPQAAPRQAA